MSCWMLNVHPSRFVFFLLVFFSVAALARAFQSKFWHKTWERIFQLISDSFFYSPFLFLIYSLSNSASFSDLQYFRHAATIAAVAAAALPPSPSSSTNPNNVPIGSLSAIGSGAPSAVDFHPAYRIPGYMEHLYSLQHSGASAASSLHGKIVVIYF